MPNRHHALVEAAARNNASWCAAVCTAHGVASGDGAGVWSAGAPTPDGYPEAVTLAPGLDPARVLASLAPGATSVKDSFADVDLSAHGFHVLFDAQWIGQDARSAAVAAAAGGRAVGPGDSEPADVDRDGDLAFERVRSAGVLGHWAAAHGNRAAFVPALLDDPAVAVLGVRTGDDFTAGAILNGSGDAVGVSNTFGPAASVYRAVGTEAQRRFPGLPVVGWESADDLAAPLAAGFAAIGPLRVWVR